GQLRSRLQRRRLQAKPQTGQGRSELMRSVGDELPPSFEYRGEAISQVVEGVSALSMLRRALRLRAGFEVPGLHAPGSFGKPLKRAPGGVGGHHTESRRREGG